MSEIVGTISKDQTATGNIGTVYGKDGLSAYQIALKNGFIGAEKEWLESLHGQPGYTPERGVDYWTKDDIDEIKSYVDKTASGSIVNEASGSIITLNDSSNRELQGLTLYGKNLSPNASLFLEQNGGTLSFEDNLLTLNGTTSGNIGTGYIEDGSFLLKPGTYTFSATKIGGTNASSEYFYFGLCKPDTNWLASVGSDGNTNIVSKTFTVETEIRVSFRFVGNGAYDHLQYQIQVERGTTATPYIPYFSGGDVTVKVMGKNLIDYRKAIPRNSYDTVVIDERINGLYWNGTFFFYIPVNIPAGTTIKFSCESESMDATDNYINAINVHYTDDTSDYVNNSISFTLLKDVDRIEPRRYHTGTSNEIKVWNLQLEIGTTATEHEPYKEPQTLVVPVPDGLAAGEQFEVENFAQLHTYKPNTTITNDVGAIMEVEYVADTKAYIDNKFTELQNAILASGANV